MTDKRKYALLLAATILAAHKLASFETTGPTPAKICAAESAIDQAMFILDRIEARWPVSPK